MDNTPCDCNLKCFEVVPESQRKKLFHGFWRVDNFKTPEASLEFVQEHISCFPKYKSHYSRSDNPSKHYLNPDLTINKMYQLYKEECFK